jgi:hypothetical protein
MKIKKLEIVQEDAYLILWFANPSYDVQLEAIYQDLNLARFKFGKIY